MSSNATTSSNVQSDIVYREYHDDESSDEESSGQSNQPKGSIKVFKEFRSVCKTLGNVFLFFSSQRYLRGVLWRVLKKVNQHRIYPKRRTHCQIVLVFDLIYMSFMIKKPHRNLV